MKGVARPYQRDSSIGSQEHETNEIEINRFCWPEREIRGGARLRVRVDFGEMTELRDLLAIPRKMAPLCLLLGISACESELTQAARAKGAVDLGCPADLVTAYRVEGGGYVARGCEQWIEYTCVYSGGAVCAPQSEPHPHPTPGS